MDKKFQDITHAIFNTMQWYLISIGAEGILSYSDDYISEHDYTIYLLNNDGYIYTAIMTMTDNLCYDSNAPKLICILDKHITIEQKYDSSYVARKNTEGKVAENIVKDLVKHGFTKIALPEKEYPYKYKYEG